LYAVRAVTGRNLHLEKNQASRLCSRFFRPSQNKISIPGYTFHNLGLSVPGYRIPPYFNDRPYLILFKLFYKKKAIKDSLLKFQKEFIQTEKS